MVKPNYNFYLNQQLNKLVNFLISAECHPDERWAEVPAPKDTEKMCEGRYFVSSTGRVISLYKNEPYEKTQEIQNGYYRVKLYEHKNYYVHSLVATAFLKKPDTNEPLEVHHKNLNPLDNRASNLVFMTVSEHRKLHSEINRKREERKKRKSANEKSLLYSLCADS